MSRATRLAGAVCVTVLACVLSFYGMHMASYALGRPDSPRFVVGVFVLVTLGLVAGVLAPARRLVDPRWLPAPVAVAGALALVPLVVVSWPLQYDQDPPSWALFVAAVGFVLAAGSLLARSRWRVLALSLVGFYVACVLMDVLRA